MKTNPLYIYLIEQQFSYTCGAHLYSPEESDHYYYPGLHLHHVTFHLIFPTSCSHQLVLDSDLLLIYHLLTIFHVVLP